MALEGDVSAGLLGAGLAQRLRLQVQAKEDLRQRQMSLGGESDTSSLYFSVGSHFEEGEGEAANKEGGGVASTEDVVECGGSSRRRRHGNYAPTPQLLLWLESTESATDEADQPWPFSESVSLIGVLRVLAVMCCFTFTAITRSLSHSAHTLWPSLSHHH